MPAGSQAYGIAQLITVAILFVIILIAAYFVARWAGGLQKARGAGGNIEMIETFRLAPSRFVAIMRIGKRYFAVAVGKDEMSLLAELAEEDLSLRTGGNAGGRSFKELLDRFRLEKK